MSLTIILLVLTSLLPARALAQERLTLAEAVSQALARHPQLAVGAQRIAVSEGLRRQAELRPNPRFFLQTENLRPGGSTPFMFSRDTDNFAYLTQVIELGDKRARRIEAAQAGVRHTEVEREMTEREIASRVSLAYWTAAGAATLTALLEQDTQNFERIVEYHRDRVREGAMAEADLIRVEVEKYRLQASARNAAQEADRLAIVLLREMGRSDFPKLALAEPAPTLEELPPPNISAILDARPEMRLARQSVQRANANVRLQRANVRPDPDLLFGYKRTAGFNTMLAGVQINLPVFHRNQGLISSAEAEVRAAEAQVAATEAMVKGEVAAAWSEAQSRRRTLLETLAPMQQRAGEMARIAQAAYREGGMDLLRLLDAERTRIETQVLYHRALAEYQQSLAGLRIASGIAP